MSKVICAWCGKVIGMVDTKTTSHGICGECAKQFEIQLKDYEKNKRGKK